MDQKKHTLNIFDENLDELIELLSSLGSLVVDLIEFSQSSLHEKKISLVQEARIKDKKINELYREIDQKSITILALKKPVAIDLRFVVAVMKIAALYEKMADRSKSIITHSQRIELSLPENIIKQLDKMNKEIIKMVSGLNKNIVKYNFPKLKQLFDNDDKIDYYYEQLLNELIASNSDIVNHPKTLVALVYIIKNYERIGDYSVKIIKQIHYVEIGEFKKKL